MAAQQQVRPGSAISKVAPEYITNRQGKDFVAFVGLLEEGTKRGIKRMVSQLVQAPTDQNGHLAIMQGTVEFDDGRIFSSIGDASPENVGRMIAGHIVRMAETRAFARALRHGLNIGGTALEELGGEADDDDRRGGQNRQDAAGIDPQDQPATPKMWEGLRAKVTALGGEYVLPTSLTVREAWAHKEALDKLLNAAKQQEEAVL